MLGKGISNSMIIIKRDSIVKVSGSGIKTVITIPNSR